MVYLEPFFVRDGDNTNVLLEHLVEAYGKWPKHMITDGGWLWAAFSFWQVEGVIRWRVIKGGERSVIEGFWMDIFNRVPLPWGQRPASRAVVLPDRQAFPQDGSRLGYRAIPEAELKPRSSEELGKGP